MTAKSIKLQHAIWKNRAATYPQYGQAGLCWPASGHDDPESAEEGAYLFQPEGEDEAYYCDPQADLEFLISDPTYPSPCCGKESIALDRFTVRCIQCGNRWKP